MKYPAASMAYTLKMPLMLEEEEVNAWILDDSVTEQMLSKVPGGLKSRTDYEQMTLF